MPNPLFESEVRPINEQLVTLHRLIKDTRQYHISFGMFKSKSGHKSHNAMVAITNNKGESVTGTFEAESFHDMVDKTVKLIEQSGVSPSNKK